VQAATSTRINGEQALVLATPTGLSVSRVNSLKKLSVQTLDLKERSATKLAYAANTLATGSVERSVDSQTGEIIQRGMIELRDATTLQRECDNDRTDSSQGRPAAARA
jgi:DNA damage-binding protein 1